MPMSTTPPSADPLVSAPAPSKPSSAASATPSVSASLAMSSTSVDAVVPPASSVAAAPAVGAPSKPSMHKNSKWKHPAPPPTNCVVLKNLDYSITQITLEEVVRRVTGGRKEFVNIALIDDKATGSFRGMAFVNFHSVADASAALSELSKMVINGRKVIAEFRRLRPGEKEKQEKRAKKFDMFHNSNRQTFERDIQETDEKGMRMDKRAAFFAKRDTVKKVDELKRIEEKAERDKDREAEFRKILLDYREAEVAEGATVEDLVLDSSLTSYERRMVHTICAGLELGHISRVDEQSNRVLHVSKDPAKIAEWERETAKIKPPVKKEETQKRKGKENGTVPEWKKGDVVSGGPLTKEELQGIKWFKPRAALAASSDPADSSASAGIRPPSYKLYVPPRQPSGPDGTLGFSSRIPGGQKGAAAHSTKENDVDDAVSTCDREKENEVGEIVKGADFKAKVALVAEGNSEKEPAAFVDEKHQGKQTEDDKSTGSSHTVLNPSVPAFSPSFMQTY